MQSGHIKLYRQMMDWQWYQDSNTKALFLHCLFMSNWKDGKFMNFDIPRGSFATSLDSLAQQTGMSVQQVRTSLAKLEQSGEIVKKSTNKFTIIKVVNYRVFQDEDFESNKQITNKQQTNNKQITTIEERKNSNNNIYIYGEFKKVTLTDTEYQKLVDEFGESGADQLIQILDNYKSSSGKTYKSDYSAIRNWVIDKYKLDQSKKIVKKESKKGFNNYSSGITETDKKVMSDLMKKYGDKYRED